jgi:hypothetical protein
MKNTYFSAKIGLTIIPAALIARMLDAKKRPRLKFERKGIEIRKRFRLGMRNLIISALILLALACSSQSLEAIEINQESGMTILANFTNNLANQSENATITQNQTNQTQTNSRVNNATTGLWSWGKIPIGYELDKNGTLTKLADEQWKPSI